MPVRLWSSATTAPIVSVLAFLAIAALGVVAALYAYAGVYGLNVLLRRGGTLWHATGPDDPSLSPSMRLALRGNLPAVTPGAFA